MSQQNLQNAIFNLAFNPKDLYGKIKLVTAAIRLRHSALNDL